MSVSAIVGQNRHVPLARISWLVTVGICLIAALLLLLNGYFGYSGVLLAVGAAAAVNLLYIECRVSRPWTTKSTLDSEATPSPLQ